jgi:hypothetical protein
VASTRWAETVEDVLGRKADALQAGRRTSDWPPSHRRTVFTFAVAGSPIASVRISC